jgi:hypothetical protein
MGGEGIYYSVEGARMLDGRAPEGGEMAPSRARARCNEVDARASKAKAETVLVRLDGRMLARFEMLYHVIPEAQFEVLFAAHAQPTR